LRIEFIRGHVKGTSVVMRRDLAEDRIYHGWAIKSAHQGMIVGRVK
jgi:hypothetical protein